MANLFVDSAAAGLNDGTTWTDAYTTYGAAVTASNDGDYIVVANTHSENLGAITTYTLGNDVHTISSTVVGSTTITATKATVKQIFNTASSHDITFTCGDGCTLWGLYVSAGRDLRFNDLQTNQCTTECGFGNAGASSISTSGTAIGWESNYDNRINKATSSSDPVVANSNRSIVKLFGGTIESDRTTESAAHTAIGVFSTSGFIADGVDCSNFQMSTLVETSAVNDGLIQITRFKLNSLTTTLLNTTATKQSAKTVIEGVDENNVYQQYRNEYRGELFSDDAIYVADADAKPVEVSNKIVTNAKTEEFFSPVRFPLGVKWVDVSTVKTFTVEIAQDGTTTNLTDAEIWLEVQYPAATVNNYLYDDDRAVDNQTTADQTTSSTTWTGLSGTNARQKLEVTTTQSGKEGLCQLFVCVAKKSTTVYVSPVPAVS